MSNKYRNWCVTDFEMDKTFWENLWKVDKLRYIYAGEETCKTTERPHWQMWVSFTNTRSVNGMHKLLKPRHVEPMKGSIMQNENYCRKEGETAFEFGELPKQGKRNDIEDIMKRLKEKEITANDVAETDPALWCIYRRAFNDYQNLLEEKRNWVTEVICIWGRAGAGKTRMAIEDGATMVQISGGRFIQGYNGEDVVLFDDFEYTKMERDLWLKLCDRYPMIIDVKGGERNWKPRKIYFTCNYDPKTWYAVNSLTKGLVVDAAVQRRISKTIHMV